STSFVSLNANVLQRSFEFLAPQSDRLAKRVFEKLLKDYPQYRPLFAKVEIVDLRQRLIQSLALVVKSAQRPETMVRYLSELGIRHAEYGITDNDYRPFTSVLLGVLAEFSGARWTPEVKTAWEEV